MGVRHLKDLTYQEPCITYTVRIFLGFRHYPELIFREVGYTLGQCFSILAWYKLIRNYTIGSSVKNIGARAFAVQEYTGNYNTVNNYIWNNQSSLVSVGTTSFYIKRNRNGIMFKKVKPEYVVFRIVAQLWNDYSFLEYELYERIVSSNVRMNKRKVGASWTE